MTASNQLLGGLEESRAHSLPFEVLPAVRNGQSRQPRTVWQKQDLSVPVIEPNRVVFHSESRFRSWRNAVSRKFLEQSFGIREVREVEIDTLSRTATLSFQAGGNPKRVLGKIARVYRGEQALELNPTFSADIFRVLPKTLPRLRAFRYGETISTWELRLSLPGWMRLRNALVINKPHFGEALERELLSVMGVEEFRLHPNAGSISIALTRVSFGQIKSFGNWTWPYSKLPFVGKNPRPLWNFESRRDH
jgi:hypothetical protein